MDTSFGIAVIFCMCVWTCAGYGSPFFSDEPIKDIEGSSKCGECNESACPKLQYCVAEVVKDRCKCCNICSTDMYQSRMRQDSPSVTDTPCAKVKCPKYKVCMENMQGLPLCSCPSIYTCRRKKKEVCGTDNLTYHSKCHLRIAACNMGKRVKVKHKDACTEQELVSTGQELPRRKNRRKSKRRRKNKKKFGQNNKLTEFEDRDGGERDVTDDAGIVKRERKKGRGRQKRRQRKSRRKRTNRKSKRFSRKYKLLPYRF